MGVLAPVSPGAQVPELLLRGDPLRISSRKKNKTKRTQTPRGSARPPEGPWLQRPAKEGAGLGSKSWGRVQGSAARRTPRPVRATRGAHRPRGNFSPRCHERPQRVGEGGRAPQPRRPHPRGRKLDVRPPGAPGHCSATRQARPSGPRRPAFRCNPFPALSLKTLWGEERKIRLPRRCKRQPSRKQKNQQNRLSSSTEGQQQHFPSS